MTLVLSMNTFCEHRASEGDPEIPEYQPLWESEPCFRVHTAGGTPLECAADHLAQAECHFRRGTVPVAASRIAYFKRKYVEEKDPHPALHGLCPRVRPGFEDRTHVLRLSLDKLRFIEDPEAFLRRSVLINNLLRRLRTEILLQSNWCFPAPLQLSAVPSPPNGHCPWETPAAASCFGQTERPYRKRLRATPQPDDCLDGCCCYYGGCYLRLPFPVCHETPSSSTSSSSSPFCSSSSALGHQHVTYEEEAKLDRLYPHASLPRPERQHEMREAEGPTKQELTFGCVGDDGASQLDHVLQSDLLAWEKDVEPLAWREDIQGTQHEPPLCCTAGRKM
ncbi:SERTA domain-containing protein 4 [Erpetoichthys calabaricus]|uniref:SERTA domain-containing protein 4 n=1 Tax=Erpetoichthys calabaricus TaxID=27687 RepID=UPI002234120D|nr:SERTA domain-containing protein 4 [Erpetoichthys calabaricus]XP_051781404.1 SERTA domain-containing protein 4 [Erpetoichthys calabaricus]XP_051781405.1 SERTA domain-containing protein 4 [Erpetoichthys calabaricus]XP_051781406.1 SERTA domain-containing protein 4 [Erpetoichthys calabaricus]